MPRRSTVAHGRDGDFQRKTARASAARRLLYEWDMETLIDPFELLPPGAEPTKPPRMRPRMASIVIDVEWEDPAPSSSLHGVRVWATED